MSRIKIELPESIIESINYCKEHNINVIDMLTKGFIRTAVSSDLNSELLLETFSFICKNDKNFLSFISGFIYETIPKPKYFCIPLPNLVTSEGEQQYLTHKDGTFFASKRNCSLRQSWQEKDLVYIPEEYKKYAELVEE